MRAQKNGIKLFEIIIMLSDRSVSTIVLATVSAIVAGSVAVEIYAAIKAFEKEEPKLFGLKEYSKPKSVPPRETTCGAVCGGNIHDQEKRTTPDER